MTPVLLVPLTPPPTRHLVDVSDSHSVASHPVCPSLTPPVYVASPMPPPCTVTLVDPVAPLFPLRITLMLPTSVEYASVRLPDRSPTVTDTLRVPLAPPPTRHLVDVRNSTKAG